MGGGVLVVPFLFLPHHLLWSLGTWQSPLNWTDFFCLHPRNSHVPLQTLLEHPIPLPCLPCETQASLTTAGNGSSHMVYLEFYFEFSKKGGAPGLRFAKHRLRWLSHGRTAGQQQSLSLNLGRLAHFSAASEWEC